MKTRTGFRGVVAVVMLLLFPALLWAVETQSGVIQSVGTGEITIRTENGESEVQTIRVASDALITLDGKPVKLEELQPQQTATVVFEREGTQLVAKEINAVRQK